MAYANGAVVSSSGQHRDTIGDRSSFTMTQTRQPQQNLSGHKQLEVSNSMCYRSRGGVVMSPSSPQCSRSVETPASILDADLGNPTDFGYRDDRIQNDLLDEICSDIGIRDAIDLDFLDFDSVVGGNDKDLADLDKTTPISRAHREFGLSADTCSSMMSPVSLAGDAACDSDRPQSNASADSSATPSKGLRHYSNIQNLTRPSQRIKASAMRRTTQPAQRPYTLDSPVTDNEKLRRQQSGENNCSGAGDGPIELTHTQPSTPPHAAKRARVITSGDDLLAEVRECYAYVRGADMYASQPPSTVGSPDCMHGSTGYADGSSYQRAKTADSHGKENYFTPHSVPNTALSNSVVNRLFYNDNGSATPTGTNASGGGVYPPMAADAYSGVRTVRPAAPMPAMSPHIQSNSGAMNMSIANNAASACVKALDMSARASSHPLPAHRPQCHPSMPQRPYPTTTTPYYGTPNGQYYAPQQSNMPPTNQQYSSGPAMMPMRHHHPASAMQRHSGSHINRQVAPPVYNSNGSHVTPYQQNYTMHSSATLQRADSTPHDYTTHSQAPQSTGQQLLHRLMSSDESSVFRAHPLFPLLRDLIIADLNFHSPSFPFALIANLPADFDRLLHNYLSRNPPAAAAHNSAMYRTESRQSVSNVIDEALRFAHCALIEKISSRKHELGYRDVPKPLSAIEEFCERFDRAVKNTSDQSLCNSDSGKLPGSTYTVDSASPRRPSSSSPLPTMHHRGMGGCASVGSSPLKSRPPDIKTEDSCGARGGVTGESGVKNKVLPKEAVAAMLSWLRQHQDNPYPNDDEKEALISQTRLTINQINYWFTNARRRILPKWTLQRYMDHQQQQPAVAEHMYGGGTALARM